MSLDSDDLLRPIREEAVVREVFHGAICGVEFDLRLAELTPEKWACPPLRLPSQGHPGFHFTTSLDDDFQVRRAARRGMDVLMPGDRVKVSHVEMARGHEDALALEPDTGSAVVHLEVSRARGGVERLSPLMFRRRGQLDDGHDEMETLQALSDRLLSLRAVLGGGDGFDEVDRLASQVLEAKQEIERALMEECEEMLRSAPTDDVVRWRVNERVWFMFDLARLVNVAALYGYRQGRTEAASAMEPLARKTLARREQSRRAASQPRLRARADFAQTYWRDHPTATCYAVAKAYCTEAKHGDEDLNSVSRSIKRYCPPTSPSYKGTRS